MKHVTGAELEPTQWSQKVPLTDTQLKSLGKEAITFHQVPDTPSPPFVHMIAGKVIISMKALQTAEPKVLYT